MATGIPIRRSMALHRGALICLQNTCGVILICSNAHLHTTRSFRSEPGGGNGEVEETHGTPLHGTTLLHICADYDEIEIARWLLERGMNVNERAAVDADGFGGHTALFATVVSQPNFWMNQYGRIPAGAVYEATAGARGGRECAGVAAEGTASGV